MSTTTVLLTTLCAADNIQLSTESASQITTTQKKIRWQNQFVVLRALPSAGSSSWNCTAESVLLHRHMSGSGGGGGDSPLQSVPGDIGLPILSDQQGYHFKLD